MITFNSIDISSKVEIDYSRLKKWIKFVIDEEKKLEGDIQYLLCTDSYLHKVNIDFLDHDTFTDIITFPTTNNKNIISGEIYFSLDRILENAKKFGVEYKSEFARVVVHGVLHLIGYEDKTKEQQKKMRYKENFYLEKFESM